MIQRVLTLGLLVAALGLAVQDANAFWHGGFWRGYGRGYGSCGYGGWAYGGYGGYGGYNGGWGYGGGVPVGYWANARVANPSPTSDQIMLTVNLPADAKVFVNGKSTKSLGEKRQYFSRGLQPNGVYSFTVRAEFERDGKPVSEEKRIQVAAGQSTSLNFNETEGPQVAGMATTGR